MNNKKSTLIFEAPFLDAGSSGRAVAVLQLLLITHGHAEEGQLIDGVFGDVTVKSVMNLQQYLEIDVDGNFGQATRAAWEEEELGVKLNEIPIAPFFQITKAIQPDGAIIEDTI